MTAAMRTALEAAARELRRLADPTEIAGFGDATDPHNDSPEMRARLAKAERAAQAATDALAGEDAETEITKPVHVPHEGDCNTACFAGGPWENTVNRRMASGVTTRDDRDEWVPAIPLPFYGLRKGCSCGRKFWTSAGYRGHYALTHVLALP